MSFPCFSRWPPRTSWDKNGVERKVLAQDRVPGLPGPPPRPAQVLREASCGRGKPMPPGQQISQLWLCLARWTTAGGQWLTKRKEIKGRATVTSLQWPL